MLIVGDIHGKYDDYLKLLTRFSGEHSVQIGDFGRGFHKEKDRAIDGLMPADAWFFRGNHDNPTMCRNSSHYLGDYGVSVFEGVKFFFVAGAWSIDHYRRTEGVNWWRDEEQSIAELNKAFDLYMEVKPDVMLSHDGPKVATAAMLGVIPAHKEYIPTRTDQALGAMLAAHAPKYWFFGHWHLNWSKQIGKTMFRCLPELGFTQITKETLEAT